MLPNFLIVGAAKCGTTSLYYYLKQHPEIYMSPVKEPNFISFQFEKFPYEGHGDSKLYQRAVKTYRDYCNLFSASRGKKAIGEASVINLYYYEKTIPFIKELIGTPKIIIMLRDPVERAFSAYLHFVRDSTENLTFEQALVQEEERKKDHWSPYWFYGEMGFYYDRVKAYTENFDKVAVFLYDDLKDDPIGLMRAAYQFLEVDTSFNPNMRTKYNASGSPRIKMLNDLFTTPNVLKKILRPVGTCLLGQDRYVGLRDTVQAKNLRKLFIKKQTREYLTNVYREDVLKLQGFISRDLSRWIAG